MPDQIFVLNDAGELVTLDATDYPAEELLQSLLARYPHLLPGSRKDESGRTPWLLVAREASIPDDSLVGRFALDHLFLDRDGVPTLVEVKRASDTRARREVVAQMLDYASHFVVHWTMDRIRLTFEQTHEDAEQKLMEFLSGEDTAAYWQLVKTNLQAKRIRMIFVADFISPELRRIVEFLNEQMDPAEVLAVEIPQFTGPGIKTFVPKLLGQTLAAKEKKGTAQPLGSEWTEEKLLEFMEQNRSTAEASVAKQILDWARNRGLRIWWGKGQSNGTFMPMFDYNGSTHWTMALWTYGKIEVQCLQMQGPFKDQEKRRELLQQFNVIPGVRLDLSRVDKRPSTSIGGLTNPGSLSAFLAVWDGYLDELRQGNR